ncbi:hypothetical protein BT69DRAFT_146523 [Atractiella rhizophila]|nr:hypothetical protein BT69DRAFT_146523 [Atractiella rhizophila]
MREREELQLSLRRQGGTEDPEDEHADGEGDAADSAGVILGIHNIFIVLPQFLVTFASSIIFAILAPGKSVLGGSEKPISLNTTAIDDAVLSIRQEEVELAVDPNDWDAIGVVFRLGGVATAIAAYFCWTLRKSMRSGYEGYQPMGMQSTALS